MIARMILPSLLVFMTALTSSAAVGPDDTNSIIISAFEYEMGARYATTTSCFHVVGRYVACFHLDEQEELAQVSVVPEEALGEGEFDRENSLSDGEYLQIISQISKIRELGKLVSPDRGLVSVLLNNSYEERDEWENALVIKHVNAWDDSVASFYIIYYRNVSGKVIWYPPTDCRPIEPFGPPFDCREPSLGPHYLSVDGHDYYLAPSGQKIYKPGSEVRVLAADPDQVRQSAKELKVERSGTGLRLSSPRRGEGPVACGHVEPSGVSWK